MERWARGGRERGRVAIRVITPNKGDRQGTCCLHRLSVCLPLMYDAQYYLPPSLLPPAFPITTLPFRPPPTFLSPGLTRHNHSQKLRYRI